ncbi:hypothetical protein [Desulfosarcina ovata]|uniref:hypothetical protein n=1 Tax=Desulfosarcina ovata TaxID=83564 RepID=UPI00159DEF8C|nr:hypothetical protein [Desulfosarcina ovata]
MAVTAGYIRYGVYIIHVRAVRPRGCRLLNNGSVHFAFAWFKDFVLADHQRIVGRKTVAIHTGETAFGAYVYLVNIS